MNQVSLLCSTRLLKNARFLQSKEVGYLPKDEPLDGFHTLVPLHVLGSLERLKTYEFRPDSLADTMSKARPPMPGSSAKEPLFSGTLRFVSMTFTEGSVDHAIPRGDLTVAMEYAGRAASPLSAYASQYGPSGLSVANSPIPYEATLKDAKYNDSILSEWVNQIAKSDSLGPDSCLVFLNPSGVVNTDADPRQGVLGYHGHSSSGVPYAFVNVIGRGLTVDDRQDFYASALSHEIVEMAVDPRADGVNPEVSDSCSGNCQVDYRNYFDHNGGWLGAVATPGYALFTAGVAKPSSVAQCPSPSSACSYPPPKPGQTP